MIIKDKVIKIFCIIDEFDKTLGDEFSKNCVLLSIGKDCIRHRNCPDKMSETNRDDKVWIVFTEYLYRKVFADKGYGQEGTLHVALCPRHTSRTFKVLLCTQLYNGHLFGAHCILFLRQ